MKKILMSILALLLVVSFVGCSATNATVSDEADTASVEGVLYNLKINPEFEIKADNNLVVTEVIAKNTDAESVLAAVNVVGLSVAEAFDALTNEAKNQGFMTEEKGNTVNITILEKDDETLPTCSVCGGCGTVVCVNCHGTGIGCRCDWCNGEGVKHNGGASLDCWLCHGTGVCPECGGSGQIVVTNGEDGGVVYTAPGVAEMGVCSICWGTGGCDNCHGSYGAGDVQCDGCNGTGYLHCNDDLNGYSWCPCCWGSGIEGTGDPTYTSYYTPADKYSVDEWKSILNG